MSKASLDPVALMAKASTACSSARTLLELGDTDGASNRACYAMFDAARAALLASGMTMGLDAGRTHSGLIAAFGKHLVKQGTIARELGRSFNRAHELRLAADYSGDPIELSDATRLVHDAEEFVATLRGASLTACPPPPHSG